jgi:acyl-CoA thioester hydrolase
MPRIFVKTFIVPQEAIDLNRHVNNLQYLRWMMEASLEHLIAKGWPMERYISSGSSWVIRSHYIKYVNPAFLGDSLSIITWISALSKRSHPRKYLFWRAKDKKIIAEANTLWVFVNHSTGRPSPIPEELKATFDIVPGDSDAILRQTVKILNGAKTDNEK